MENSSDYSLQAPRCRKINAIAHKASKKIKRKACGKVESNFQHGSTSETAKTLDRRLVSKKDEELSTFGFELDAKASKLTTELLQCFMPSIQMRSSFRN